MALRLEPAVAFWGSFAAAGMIDRRVIARFPEAGVRTFGNVGNLFAGAETASSPAGRLPRCRQVADHVVEFLGIQAVGSGGGASFMPFLAASCANARMRALVRIFAFHCRSARARSPLRWDIYLPLGILVGTLAIDTSGICMKLRGICMKPVGVGFNLWSRSCR